MSKLRISIVEFLNSAPLVWGFTDGPLEGRYDLSFTVPSLCAEALRAGEADIAIIPAVEYQRMDGMVILPDMAVASKNEVRSILLLSKKPIDKVRRLALDTNSRSSVALTRLLCRGLWGISPEFIDSPPDPKAMLANADAALVIGDPALAVRLKVDALAARSPSGLECCVDSGDEDIQPVAGVDTLYLRLRYCPAVAPDDRQALRSGSLGRPARSDYARSRGRFPGFPAIWPVAHS